MLIITANPDNIGWVKNFCFGKYTPTTRSGFNSESFYMENHPLIVMEEKPLGYLTSFASIFSSLEQQNISPFEKLTIVQNAGQASRLKGIASGNKGSAFLPNGQTLLENAISESELLNNYDASYWQVSAVDLIQNFSCKEMISNLSDKFHKKKSTIYITGIRVSEYIVNNEITPSKWGFIYANKIDGRINQYLEHPSLSLEELIDRKSPDDDIYISSFRFFIDPRIAQQIYEQLSSKKAASLKSCNLDLCDTLLQGIFCSSSKEWFYIYERSEEIKSRYEKHQWADLFTIICDIKNLLDIEFICLDSGLNSSSVDAGTIDGLKSIYSEYKLEKSHIFSEDFHRRKSKISLNNVHDDVNVGKNSILVNSSAKKGYIFGTVVNTVCDEIYCNRHDFIYNGKKY